MDQYEILWDRSGSVWDIGGQYGILWDRGGLMWDRDGQ